MNPPCRAALVSIGRSLPKLLAVQGEIPDDGDDPLPIPHIPVLPSVGRSMAPDWFQPPRRALDTPDRYRLSNTLTPEQGLRLDYASYFDINRSHLLAPLRTPRVLNFLNAASAAGEIPHHLVLAVTGEAT